MDPIYAYSDYRKFLRDYYEHNKGKKRFFSYRYFAKKAELRNPGFYKLVVDGKRNLTRRMIERFSKALGLAKKEAVYFKNLVLFNQGKTVQEKQEHYLVLKSLSGAIAQKTIEADQFDYFANWYACALRELVCLRDYRDDHEKMAADLYPKVKPAQAQEALRLLLSLGLIEKTKTNTYRQTDAAITTGPQVRSMAIRSFHHQMLKLADQALDNVPVAHRNFSGMTVGISPDAYNILVAEIEAFKDRIANIVNADKGSLNVYQLNFQLFPLSRIKGKNNV